MEIIINSDKDLVRNIQERIKNNGGYCPCTLEKNEDTKCMCKEFRELTEGACHCGLYIKVR